MKTNDYLVLSGTLAFSLLFYQQHAGLNFFLFTLVVITLLTIRHRSLWRNPKWALTALLCVVSGLSVLVHASALSVFANFISLLTLSGLSYNVKTSRLFTLGFAMYSLASSGVRVCMDAVARYEKKELLAREKRVYTLLVSVAVLLLSFLFFVLYQNSNPLFAENTKWVNLKFISWGWLLFTLVGFLFVYGLYYHQPLKSLESWENNLLLHAAIPENQNSVRNEMECKAGLWLFTLLNLMLLLLNAGDISTIWFNGRLPKGVTHSDFVHSGVGVIILSILIAAALMLFLYRSDIRRVKYSRWLNLLVFGWIAQNLIMLYSTAWRNHIYVHDYNLTYKRVGVYVWLILAALGLGLMFIKIYRNRSNWYLVRLNVALWYVLLVLSATINWDRLITNYNLANKPLAEVDFHYLFSLSDSTIPELVDVYLGPDFWQIKKKLPDDAKNKYYVREHKKDYNGLLSAKLKNYLRHRRQTWQSYNVRDSRVEESLQKLLTRK